jgi:hypothetical protein
MTMKKIQSIKTEEYGFASLVVAFILILVMSLLTVGFAQVARHEQQNALNKQLANQAYYAAETGVNEIKAQLVALQAAAGPGPTYRAPYDGSACLGSPYIPDSSGSNPSSSVIDSSSDVTYSCAFVNFKTSTLIPPTTPPQSSANFIFNSTGALNQLTFSWGSKDNSNTPRTAGGFPTQAQWASGKSPSVIQFSITPIGTGGTLTRNNLISNTFTAYFYPSNGSVIDPENGSAVPGVGSVNYVAPDGDTGTCQVGVPPAGDCDDATTNAPIIDATYTHANDPYPYSVIIKNLPAATNNTWLVHYVTFYDDTQACLDAALVVGCNNTSSVDLTNSEVDIDVTAKAKDVVRRIQEVVPLPTSSAVDTTQNGISTLPTFSVDSGAATCKQFATYPSAPGAGTVAATNYNASNASPSCSLGP